MTRAENKLAAFNRLSADGPVQVHLDPRVEGVQVPEELRSQFRLVLDFGLPRGACDLRVDLWGLRETLPFALRRVPVAVPWDAVFWIRQLEGEAFFAYPYSVPQEVTEEIGPEGTAPGSAPAEPTPESEPRPRLRLVRDDEPEGKR